MAKSKLTTGPLKVKSALTVVALGVVCGAAFELLAWKQLPGLGLVLASVICAFAAIHVARMDRAPRRETILLLTGGVILIGWTMIRAAEFLAAINIIAALILLSAALWSHVYELHIWAFRIRDMFVALFEQIIEMLAGAARPIGTLVANKHTAKAGRAMPYLRGILFAIPIVLIFALLFASADALFSDFLGDFTPSIELSIGSATEHLIWICVFAWLAIGTLVFVLQPERPGSRSPQREDAPEATWPAVKERSHDWYIESMIVLGSLTVLFAIFVVFQFTYLFGGSEQIDIPGVTYAEYTREGFFQLLAVATLTVAVIWISLQAVGERLVESRRAWFRGVCTVMILMTAVILVSALKRLDLYEAAYGYTQLRLLSHVFTYWVAAVLVLLMAQLYWRSRQLFVASCVVAGFVVLFAFNAMNPDAYIAAHNLDRISAEGSRGERERQQLQLEYISELSADAIPVVLDRYRAGPKSAEARRQLFEWTCQELNESRNWREWNLGFSRAEDDASAGGFDYRGFKCSRLVDEWNDWF